MAGGLKKGSGLFIQPQRITTEFDPRGERRALLENDGSWTSYTLTGVDTLGAERVGAEPY